MKNFSKTNQSKPTGLTAEKGREIQKEYTEVKEKLMCEEKGLRQIGGNKTKIDGSDGINNKSIKHFTGKSTQVHLTTQKQFIKVLGLNEKAQKFIKYFCGNESLNFNGKDRYHIDEINLDYVNSFLQFLDINKDKVVHLMIANKDNITGIIYKNLKTGLVYEIRYDEVMEKIKECVWVGKKGGLHLKNKDGKTYFHIQREGKKNKNNRYNVLCHIHQNLFY